MTIQSTYVFTCDSIDCGKVSPPTDNNWSLPDGWSSLTVKADAKRNIENRVLHFCTKCTGAILDGFLKLHEEE